MSMTHYCVLPCHAALFGTHQACESLHRLNTTYVKTIQQATLLTMTYVPAIQMQMQGVQHMRTPVSMQQHQKP